LERETLIDDLKSVRPARPLAAHMKHMPVREILASYLLRQQDDVARWIAAMVNESPDLPQLQAVTQDREYFQTVVTLLRLTVQNIADPRDRRCFQYIRQRAYERFRQNIPLAQMLRMVRFHRNVVTAMIQEEFQTEPALSEQMIAIVHEQIHEIEVNFSDAYQDARDRQWLASETKYHLLFENASEAILSFRPGEGRIIEANAQAEMLLGRSRDELLGSLFHDLFPPQHRDDALRITQQQAGTARLRLDDVIVLRAESVEAQDTPEVPRFDTEVPVCLSCNWMQVDGHAIAQVILRDVTELHRMQRQLAEHTEQLEVRVATRTAELQDSEKRLQDLVQQERRRARHLSLINDVQNCALAGRPWGQRNLDTFLREVTAAIQRHFSNSKTTFFLCEDSHEVIEPPGASLLDTASPSKTATANATTGSACDENQCSNLLVVMHADNDGLSLPEGKEYADHDGLAAQVVHRGQTLAGEDIPGDGVLSHRPVANEVAARQPEINDTQLCVPVVMDNKTIGVICVQSDEPGGSPASETGSMFAEDDAVALQTAASIVASHLEASRMFHEMSELSEFNQTLITTMLHSLMVVNREGIVQVVNERLCQILGLKREDLLHHPASQVFGESTVVKYGLYDALQGVTESGEPRELQEVHVDVHAAKFVFDLRMFRVYFRGEAQVVVLLINLTPRWRKTHQLQLMNEVGRLLQTSLDVDRVMHTVLTAITAGSGLGFNRAFLLLRKEGSDTLEGTMALGPSSNEEASRIWQEMGQHEMSLQEIIEQAEQSAAGPTTSLQESTNKLNMSLDNPCFQALTQAVRERRAVQVPREVLISDCGNSTTKQAQYKAESAQASKLFTASEVVIAPLIAKERVVGVVLADNLYSGAPLELDDVQLLDNLARQAGLTIDNALTYQKLQQAQKELVSAERLVAVGEMAARVSHEIRNPLSTIGGFARSILKKADDVGAVQRKTQIIVGEVARLEELLNDSLDMASPRPLELLPHSINEIVEHSLLLADADVKTMNVTVEKHYATDLPLILVDRSRLLQALLNTVRNGAQSMPQGGVLAVTTRISGGKIGEDGQREQGMLEIEIKDSGVGIPERAVKQIFDPFFSTKIKGSGLGLAVTRRIVQDHGGVIDVYSQEGEGTTFIFCLPLRVAPESAE